MGRHDDGADEDEGNTEEGTQSQQRHRQTQQENPGEATTRPTGPAPAMPAGQSSARGGSATMTGIVPSPQEVLATERTTNDDEASEGGETKIDDEETQAQQRSSLSRLSSDASAEIYATRWPSAVTQNVPQAEEMRLIIELLLPQVKDDVESPLFEQRGGCGMCKKVVIVSTSTSRTSRKKGGRTGCWPVTCTTIHHPSSGGPRIGCALSAWDVMEGLSWLFLSRENVTRGRNTFTLDATRQGTASEKRLADVKNRCFGGSIGDECDPGLPKDDDLEGRRESSPMFWSKWREWFRWKCVCGGGWPVETKAGPARDG
ncbi:hypothetical protein THAOC_11583 [Thalassiosira oceanica]|uniref:Uncharacterized protein n=1 Tax=Thalassiosira oceanica TaxID=159749 RepID=K0T270_THAOC|nr:hypothetical protein THAOC_11583 [Thalassiosira oceanica]|eukprot:EJK67391.1 hypothetical protein THAOC_11583 [Thalassiosira oceanica]